MATGKPWVIDPRLTSTDRAVLAVLDELDRFREGVGANVTHATRTIGNRIGRKARAVQMALRRLIDLGYVARVLDYGLKTRRRLVLLFKGAPPAPLDAPPVSAKLCAEAERNSAPTDRPPLEPPLVGSGDEDSGNSSSSGGNRDAEAPAEQPRTTTTTDHDSSHKGGSEDGVGTCDGGRLATPEEVRETVQAAEAQFGLGVGLRIKAWARTYGLAWVRRAIQEAVKRDRRKIGYVYQTLQSYVIEGGPLPESPPDPKALASVEDMAAQMAKVRAEHAAKIGGGA